MPWTRIPFHHSLTKWNLVLFCSRFTELTSVPGSLSSPFPEHTIVALIKASTLQRLSTSARQTGYDFCPATPNILFSAVNESLIHDKIKFMYVCVYTNASISVTNNFDFISCYVHFHWPYLGSLQSLVHLYFKILFFYV